MAYIFYECNSLISLPDISKWNTSNVINMSEMLRECFSLISLQNTSERNTDKISNRIDHYYQSIII